MFNSCNGPKVATAPANSQNSAQQIKALQMQNAALQDSVKVLTVEVSKATNMAKQVSSPVVAQQVDPAVAQIISQVSSGGNPDVVLSLLIGKPAVMHELKSMQNGSQAHGHQTSGARYDSDAKEKEQKVKDNIDFFQARIDQNQFQLTNLEQIMRASDTRNPVVKSDRRALAKKLAECIARDQDLIEQAMVELQCFH
jgi:hypothetical protein